MNANKNEYQSQPSNKNGVDLARLILINDQVNTFDHVITVLVEICDHDSIQAEQCATITHYKGRCEIKTGVSNDLQPLLALLKKQGLNAILV